MDKRGAHFRKAWASAQMCSASLLELQELSQTSSRRLQMEQVRLATQQGLPACEEQVFEMYLRLTSLKSQVDQIDVNECSWREQTEFSPAQAYSKL